jgi:hypothetical protein
MSKQKGKASNKAFWLEEFTDFAVRTPWLCLRCLSIIADGNLKVYLNKLGYCFVKIAEFKGNLLSWKEFEFRDAKGNVLQSMRCKYCHSLRQACYAVSRPDWHELALINVL